MKNIIASVCFILIFTGLNIFVSGQDNIVNNKKYTIKDGKCIEVDVQNESENSNLSDERKYEKAKLDARCIASYEVKELYPLPKAEKIKVIHLFSAHKCHKYKPAEGEYVAPFGELLEFYESGKDQFSKMQDRLKQLVGSNETYKCLAVIEIETNYLHRPTEFSFSDEGKLNGIIDFQINKKKENGYPFTNLGYACDWFYGNGCQKGLSEFTLQNIEEAKENEKIKVVNACKITECAVSIIESGKLIESF